jgi:mycothiol system anti-sigma-R factor
MNEHTCEDALTELYRYLDGELDDETRAKISAHLDGCSPCLEAFDFELELRRVVATRCQEKVPDQLRFRILEVLRTCDPHAEVTDSESEPDGATAEPEPGSR